MTNGIGKTLINDNKVPPCVECDNEKLITLGHHGQSVLVLSKKLNSSFVSNSSQFAKSNCSFCRTKNNYKMDFINPGNNCLHSNFMALDKIVEVPLSKAHSSVSPRTMCKCKE